MISYPNSASLCKIESCSGEPFRPSSSNPLFFRPTFTNQPLDFCAVKRRPCLPTCSPLLPLSHTTFEQNRTEKVHPTQRILDRRRQSGEYSTYDDDGDESLPSSPPAMPPLPPSLRFLGVSFPSSPTVPSSSSSLSRSNSNEPHWEKQRSLRGFAHVSSPRRLAWQLPRCRRCVRSS